MQDAIDHLYATFAHYPVGKDFTGCDCCVGPEHSARLAAPPLRELSYDDLERYSRKAISTWGSVRHFKHFLPRLLELSIEHRDDFLDLAVVFGKLKYAQMDTWPPHEQLAVQRFFDAYWEYQLNEHVRGAYADAIDTVLCAIANASVSVQRWLDAWIAMPTHNARRHLATFILVNDDALLIKGQLANAFWDTTAQPHAEVVNWLQSDGVYEWFQQEKETSLVDEFADAWPQFMAVRAGLTDRTDGGWCGEDAAGRNPPRDNVV